jgi:ATP-dependent Clp protease ATP-binding subunit ClpA
VDLDRFRDAVRERLPGAEERANGPRLPLDPDAEAAVRAATAVAAERRREAVRGVHLLYALLQEPGGVAAKLLTEYGGNTATLMAGLEREI